MNQQPEGIWARAMKRLFNRPSLQQRPAPDLDANSDVLARLQDDDPKYRMFVDHMFAELSNNMVTALDPRHPKDLRLSYLDRAAGILHSLEEIEVRRDVLREEWKNKMREQQEQKERKR